MKAETSKSQLEVWEWKERLYAELKDIPKSKRLKFIREKVKTTVDRIKKNKKINN
ncbi:MAG: hypothetical protein ABEH43_11585 [Flavobacteriales bacterium]